MVVSLIRSIKSKPESEKKVVGDYKRAGMLFQQLLEIHQFIDGREEVSTEFSEADGLPYKMRKLLLD